MNGDARLDARSGPGRGRSAALLLALGLLGLALGACTPTEGYDGAFVQQPTTNADFTLPAATVTVGNQPIAMDLTTNAGVLDLVAVVNYVALEPTNPDGSFNPVGSVSILRNNPPGTITVLQTIDTMQFPTRALWANLNPPDTNPDLIVLDDLNEQVAVYLATGPGTFNTTPSFEFTFTQPVVQITVVDLDGDGDDDVVLTVPGGDVITTLYNDPTGTLAQVDSTAVFGLTRFVAQPLDAGTTVDLAILRPGANTLELYSGDGAGNFDQSLPSTSIAVDGGTTDLVGGDLRGAGTLDLALLGDTFSQDRTLVRLWANDGTGLFTLGPTATTTLLPRGSHIFLADTGLGPGQDVAVVHRNDRLLSFLRSNGTGFDLTPLTTTRDPIEVVYGDIDGDLNVDLVTAEDDRRTIGIFHGDGAGGFTRTQIGLTTHVAFPRLVDVDGDTDLDLPILQPYSDQLAVFENVQF
jgi:hypothetical protein